MTGQLSRNNGQLSIAALTCFSWYIGNIGANTAVF